MSKIMKVCAYPTDWGEEQSLQEILAAARQIGLEIAVDRTMSVLSEIGLFLGHHKKNVPSLAREPVIMLHDLGQAHNVWPNFWEKEPWNEYSYGLLPNQAWLNMYRTFPDETKKPRKGVKVLGWPKSDQYYSTSGRPAGAPPAAFKNRRLTVLYAPSWEFDNQQDQLVQSLRHLPVQILIKQHYWTGMGHMERVNAMAKLHGTKYRNVTILNPKTRIFDALRHTDIIVSDESSTLVEGFFAGCYPISVTDWKIPDVNPPRPPSVPFPFVQKVQTKDLSSCIAELSNIEAFSGAISQAAAHAEYIPENHGCSAATYADFLNQLATESVELNI